MSICEPQRQPFEITKYVSMFKSKTKPGAKQRLLFNIMWLMFGPFSDTEGKVFNSATVTWKSLAADARENAREDVFRRYVIGLPAYRVQNIEERVVGAEPSDREQLKKLLRSFDQDGAKWVGVCALKPTRGTETETDYWLLLRRSQSQNSTRLGKSFVVAVMKINFLVELKLMEITFIQNKDSIRTLLAEQQEEDQKHAEEERIKKQRQAEKRAQSKDDTSRKSRRDKPVSKRSTGDKRDHGQFAQMVQNLVHDGREPQETGAEAVDQYSPTEYLEPGDKPQPMVLFGTEDQTTNVHDLHQYSSNQTQIQNYQQLPQQQGQQALQVQVMFPEVPEVLQGQEVQRRLYAHEWLYMPDDQENQESRPLNIGDFGGEYNATTPNNDLAAILPLGYGPLALAPSVQLMTQMQDGQQDQQEQEEQGQQDQQWEQAQQAPENLQFPEAPEDIQAQEPVGQYDAPQYPESLHEGTASAPGFAYQQNLADMGTYGDDIFPNAATPQPLYDALHRDPFEELFNGTDSNGEEQNKFGFGGL